jgi:hypothetical protein
MAELGILCCSLGNRSGEKRRGLIYLSYRYSKEWIAGMFIYYWN